MCVIVYDCGLYHHWAINRIWFWSYLTEHRLWLMSKAPKIVQSITFRDLLMWPINHRRADSYPEFRQDPSCICHPLQLNFHKPGTRRWASELYIEQQMVLVNSIHIVTPNPRLTISIMSGLLIFEKFWDSNDTIWNWSVSECLHEPSASMTGFCLILVCACEQHTAAPEIAELCANDLLSGHIVYWNNTGSMTARWRAAQKRKTTAWKSTDVVLTWRQWLVRLLTCNDWKSQIRLDVS